MALTPAGSQHSGLATQPQAAAVFGCSWVLLGATVPRWSSEPFLINEFTPRVRVMLPQVLSFWRRSRALLMPAQLTSFRKNVRGIDFAKQSVGLRLDRLVLAL